MRIYLIGYMGSGKSTVARLLADRLDYKYIDTDEIIENFIDSTIRDYFDEVGEEAFRVLESEVLDALNNIDDCVISTGGGMPCYFNGIKKISSSGVSIYLQNTATQLAERIFPEREKRPLIQHIESEEALKSEIESGLENRKIYYEQAQIIIDANQDLDIIVNLIVTKLKELDLIKLS